MGLGDFLKGVAGATVNATGAGPALNWAGKEIGEHFLHYAESGGGGGKRDAAGHATVNPANPASRITAPTHNLELKVGEEYGRNIQNQVNSIEGYAKLGRAIVTHPVRSAKTARTIGSEVVQHPGILWDAAKTVAVDQAISTAMNPTTYMGGGLVMGTMFGEQMAARSAERAGVAVTEEAATRAATEVSERAATSLAAKASETAAREAAPIGVEAAKKATLRAAARTGTRSGRVLNAIDEAPVNTRERLTGNPMGKLGQKRYDLGERLMPGPQEGLGRALLKDTLQGSPTMPTEGAGLAYRQGAWRAQRAGSMLGAPARFRTAEHIGQVLNDPKGALTSPEALGYATQAANWAIKEHPEAAAAVGGLVAANYAVGAYGTIKGIKSALGGDGEASGAETSDAEQTSAASPPQSPQLLSTQDIGLSQFRLDQTHATRTSRRRPNAAARLGTVTRDSTMPTQIGPSNWYGPQGGYDAGRGFSQRDARPTMGLPPLKQPARAPQEVLGI